MITPQKSSQKTNREPNLNLLGCSQFDLNLFREGTIKILIQKTTNYIFQSFFETQNLSIN